MINITNLSFSYFGEENAKKALVDINLRIQEGEFIGIIGSSGAGKSTFTMALNGIVPHFYRNGAFYGEVNIAGHDTVESTCHQLSQIVGSVLQDPASQMITSCVEEEVAFALENQGLPREEIEKRITESLDLCGISTLRQRNIAELSGGQMQRVAIACAVAQKPKLLVLDEPTSELDPIGSTLIFETLKMLNEKQGMTIIIVEQKVMLLAEYCSKMMVMDKGRILMEGPTRQVLENYNELETLGINCPRVVRLAALLKEEGMHHGSMPVNVEETYQILKSL